MQRIIQWTTLATIALTLSSCGLPAAIGRSAGRVMQGVGDAAGKVMTTGF